MGSESSRLPHFLDNRLTDSGEVVSPSSGNTESRGRTSVDLTEIRPAYYLQELQLGKPSIKRSLETEKGNTVTPLK
jgi:hypothetical protein